MEIIVTLLFIASGSYFFITLWQIKQRQAMLQASRAQLMIEKGKQSQKEERNQTQTSKDHKETFELALKEAGFNILSVEKNINYVKATVANNLDARARLLKILNNIQYTQLNDDELEIVWLFDKPFVDNQTNELKLDAICFFNEDSWQVWINGKMYDSKNRELNEGGLIEHVTDLSVTIKDLNEEKIILELN